METSDSAPHAERPRFSGADCAVFGQTRAGAPWTDLGDGAQEQFRSLRTRLKTVAQALVEPATRASVSMMAFVATLNPSGRVPRALWSCVYPAVAGNKSFALQFAVIVNGTGAEICCCLGAGSSQVAAADVARKQQEAWASLHRRLATVPNAVRESVETGIGDRWHLRKSWLLEPGGRDFASFHEWLIFAASETGAGASISRYLTPDELGAAGKGLLTELLSDVAIFAPLFSHLYGADATRSVPQQTPMKIADDFELHPLLLEDLTRVHQELRANGELRSREALEGFYETFRQRFGPEELRAHDGESLLSLMHETTHDGMIYWLEFKDDDEFPSIFGSIAGGSALKYGFYRRQETGEWTTGSPKAQRTITIGEAVALACRNRDQLVAASALLATLPRDSSAEAYTTLQQELARVAPDVQDSSWGHKYLSLIHPDKLEDFHGLSYQRLHLVKLLQEPSTVESRYANASCFVALGAALQWPLNHITTVLNRRNGPPHYYWRVGTRAGDGGPSYWDRMQRESIVAVGWSELGDLTAPLANDGFKDVIRERLVEASPAAPAVIGRGAQQLSNFCKRMGDGDYVLACDGATVLGIGRITGPYHYSATQEFPHERPVDWLDLGEWRLPTLEGLRTTVHEYRKHFDNLVAVERRVLEAKPTEKIDRLPGRTHATWTGARKIGRIQDLLNRKGQAILYGPPGTGKTYWAEQAVQNLAALWNCGVAFGDLSDEQRERVTGHRPDAFVRVCTFHPSYGYEDFIEGFRPTTTKGTLGFAVQNGIFKTLCRAASEDPEGRYYLIVDEINRGDIPRIFGELLTLLDKPKRGSAVLLPLSGDRFVVPENVFIVGTMNTADRSIALLDTALRRRFGFIELMPDPSTLGETVIEGIALRPWLTALNQQVTAHVGRDGHNLQVGHSYLMSAGRPIQEFRQLARVLQEDVLPLLEEYCYEEWDALERILGSGLVDVAKRRFKAELFEPARQPELVQAILAVTPDVSASAAAVAAEVAAAAEAADSEDEEEDGET